MRFTRLEPSTVTQTRVGNIADQSTCWILSVPALKYVYKYPVNAIPPNAQSEVLSVPVVSPPMAK
ncbi:unnamed protein product [Fusarium venenatum]|uniref:Uncharacterized protein n=1 Tax=Fusarium venenatum TaxID=56646 RepID=A0A2L2TX91_9HYPO|nr:uncharacterized protein FVRRES_01807 [Fusarium venenatum]CEI65295.1 unnamed protein product [Fusarium venenatum]